jgi:hypothetical protein
VEGGVGVAAAAAVEPVSADVDHVEPDRVDDFDRRTTNRNVPELMSGTWTCTGNTLVSTAPPASGVTATWTLTRTGPG